jgi:transcriptional antiterminator RfaH
VNLEIATPAAAEGRARAPSLPASHITASQLATATRFASRTWYAVQCQPRREEQAARNLKNQEFGVFLPRRMKTRRHARKLENVATPFFPGYLFVHFDIARDRWRAINGTYGVVRLVGSSTQPAQVPSNIVDALLGECDAVGMMRPHLDFVPGQSVRVTVGPFADFIGTLDRLDDDGRVRVLLDMMGGRIPLFLARENIAPANDCG